MKLLKASFLLAAAATTTQLDATDFRLTYAPIGGSTEPNASATGTIGINTSLLPNPGSYSDGDGIGFSRTPIVPPAWLTSFTLTVSGITGAESNYNGTYTMADLNHLGWSVSSAINLSNEIVGQPGFNWLSLALLQRMNGPHNHGSESRLYSNGHSLELELTSFILSFSGVTDVAAWLSSINDQNRIYTNGSTLAGLPLEGAHHRPMLSFDRMGKVSQAWATGDFGSSSRTRDVHVTSGEAGINWNIGKSFLFGVAGGHAVQNQDLAFGGSSATKGDFAIAELDYRPEGTQWIVSLLGMVGSWESKTNRGYTSGASLDSSYGVADTITRSARLRVDAPSLATFGGFGFAPYASYTVTQTVVGAYTETGGGFPASFNEQEHNATEARLGVTASKDLSATTKLLLSVEGIHRFDGVGPALTGQDVTGGVSFSLPGVAPRPDCVRFGFDVDHKLSADTLLNVSAHVSTVGEAHDVSAAISIRRAF
jgi:uncharacterized protein with beta-barrel porin domain